MNTYELAGKQWPILGGILCRTAGGVVPLLDIPMMSDDRWRELAKEHPVPEGAA